MVKKVFTIVGLDYQLSTHSFRKFYGETIYLLHPQDADNLMIIQTILGHSDINTTKLYIHYIDRKMDKYNEDYAQYMINKINGVDTDISNSPIVSIKAEDFRELLSKCWDMASNGKDKFDSINEILGIAEQMMV